MFSRRFFILKAVLSLVVLVLSLIALIMSGCSDEESNPVSATADLPELAVTPQVVAASSFEGSSMVERVHIQIDVEPYDAVRFNFSCESSWMTVSNVVGTSYGTTRDSISIVFDVADLGVGVYVDSVKVWSQNAENSPQYVEVTYTIVAIPPDMLVGPHFLTFTAASLADTLPPRSLQILCADGSYKSYSLEESADWIVLSRTSGATPDTVEVMVDMSGLITGSHVDTIKVTSEDMSNSPIPVVCSLFTPVWQLQEYAYESYVLEDVVFADANTGWAVGYVEETNSRSGYLLETFDGGDNWKQRRFLNAGPDVYLAFVGAEAIGSDAWAIAENGILYHSPDLGLTWDSSQIDLPDTGDSLRGMDFVTADVGWIIGIDGLILKTTDGGNIWVEQESGTNENLLAVSFVDENRGWIIGYGYTLLRTTDGGDSWAPPTTGPLSNCRDVFFVDINTGWIVGSEGNIFRTNNGGGSWVSQESGVDVWLQSIHFVDDLTGWAAGQDGVVLHTTDAGETWQEQVSGSSSWLQSVFFYDELRGWVAGQYGEIRSTTSGGQ